MSTTSRSDQWQVENPTRNWLELPTDLMVNILQRVGVIDKLENVQLVCKAWCEICKDPALWRVIRMVCSSTAYHPEIMCRNAVKRSQGQLIELSMLGFCNYGLLDYVANSGSSQLRGLEIKWFVQDMYGAWSEVLKEFPLLEKLFLTGKVSREKIEVVGRYCPMLKILLLRQEDTYYSDNEVALAIGKNLPQLSYLEYVGSDIGSSGLQAILDGCFHLETLDLSRCVHVEMKGDLEKRCSLQIKHLKLPRDFDTDSDNDNEYDDGNLDSDDEHLDYDDEYDDGNLDSDDDRLDYDDEYDDGNLDPDDERLDYDDEYDDGNLDSDDEYLDYDGAYDEFDNDDEYGGQGDMSERLAFMDMLYWFIKVSFLMTGILIVARVFFV